MSYEIGTHFTFATEPAETRQSMEWDVGVQIAFMQVADEPRIFLPRLRRGMLQAAI